jgi:hypothetical protein
LFLNYGLFKKRTTYLLPLTLHLFIDEVKQKLMKMTSRNNKTFQIILAGTLLIFFLYGLPSFSQTTFKMPTRPYGAVVVDYDLDGDNDVVVGCSAISSTDIDSIVIMFNDGWGNFEIQGFEANSGIFIYCEDMNNDGFPDIISRGDSIFFHENDQNGGLGALYNICHTIGNRRIGGIADMDANGFLDIVYYGTQVIRGWGIAYNIDGYTFNDNYLYYSDENEYPSVGYLNNDSLVDVLITARSIPEGAYIMHNNIDTFQKEMISTRHWAFTYVIDVNNNGLNEAVLEIHSALHYVDSWLFFFERDEHDSFNLVDSTIIKGGSRISSINDFDQDGYQDIAFTVSSWVSDPSEDSVFIYRNNQNWGFEPHESHYIGGWFYPSIISGDLNMDGYPDAVTIGYLNPNADYIQFLWNDQEGHFIDTNNVYVHQNEYNFTQIVKLYPNPNFGKFTIHSLQHEIVELKILSMNGFTKFHKSYVGRKKISIDLNKSISSAGVYISAIKLESSRVIYKKLIINQIH